MSSVKILKLVYSYTKNSKPIQQGDSDNKRNLAF